MNRNEHSADEPLRPAEAYVGQVYDALRAAAARVMQNERADHTLDPTALVHEVYLRFARERPVACDNRSHFLAVASRRMRQILVNHAHARGAAKRGGGAPRLTLSGATPAALGREIELLDLDTALRELETLNERHARVIELRYFGGLTIDETAAALGVSRTTVKEDWQFAHAWLRDRLDRDHA